MTDAGGLDLDQDFARARTIERNSGDFKRFTRREGDGGANIHKIVPRCFRVELVRARKSALSRRNHDLRLNHQGA
jgi:hypothetical protein